MKKPAIETIGKSSCTGCSACVAVCPVKTAETKENELGFLEPSISDQCENCQNCEQVCPVISEKLVNCTEPIGTYSAWSNSSEVLQGSSSGGIFYEIARLVINAGGKVSGSVMEDHRPHHLISDDLKEVAWMRGSKYTQSKTVGVLSEMRNLAVDSVFLFCGTPCQVAAVKNLWSFYNLDQKKLVTCDLICFGIPSYLVYDGYLKHFSKKRKVLSVDFRNKAFGWENYSIKMNHSNGKNRIIPGKKDMFMRSYLAGIGLRESCYNCKFSRIPRVGDITLGDFWGVPQRVKNEMGTSAVIVNSEKGREIFDELSKEKFVTLNKVDLSAITRKNRRLSSGTATIPRERIRYLETLLRQSFHTSYLKFVFPIWLQNKIQGGINRVKGPAKKLWGGNG